MREQNQVMSNPDKIIDRVLYGVDVPIFSTSGTVLMLKRQVKSEQFATGWEYAKGGLKMDENYVEAAIREASEEAGDLGYSVIIELPTEYRVDARYRKKPHYDYVVKKAVVLLAERTDVFLDHNEHVDYAWMEPEEAIREIWVENGAEILAAAVAEYRKHV